MTCFRPDGHLTDEALAALIRGDALAELDRLEIAEHLAYPSTLLIIFRLLPSSVKHRPPSTVTK